MAGGIDSISLSGADFQQFDSEIDAFEGHEASRPGKMNRSSIASVSPESHIDESNLYPKLEERTLKGYELEVVPDKEVKAQLSQPNISSEERLAQKATELQKKIASEARNAPPEVAVRSENSLKAQIQSLKEALGRATGLEREAKSLAKDSLLQVNLNKAGLLTDGQLTPAGEKAVDTYTQAHDLVRGRKKAIKQMESELKTLQREVKQAEKNAKRAARAMDDLQSSVSKLGKSLNKVRDKITRSPSDSSSELSKELKSLKQALKKANNVVKDGERLQQRAIVKSGRHGIDVAEIKKTTVELVAEARREVAGLEKEIVALQKKRKSALSTEAREKKENKKLQVQQKPAERTEQTQERERAATQSGTEAKENHHKTEAAVKAEKPAPLQSRIRRLNSDNTNIPAYLKGIKPSGRSIQAVESSMVGLKNPADFKQVMVDVASSGLALEEKVRLRSLLSSALLSVMKNEQLFPAFKAEDIEHIMFGENMNEIKAEFPKAVARERRNIDKRARQ